jgi:phosphoglycolate phosphatase-like HAD superfamily hydrolase
VRLSRSRRESDADMLLKALTFDVDGTLAETEELHRICFNDAFANAGHGWEWPRDRYCQLLKVTGGKERIRPLSRPHGP